MSLYEKLQQATSEEDVKDIYIKAIGLKGYQKGLVDIQTKEIWFEAKPNSRLSSYAMFTQLLHYVQVSLNHGESLPQFLAVIDTKKAAIMKTADVLPLLEKKIIKWGKSASGYTQEALDAVSAYIGTYLVSFRIETHEKEFIDAVKSAIKKGEIIRAQITPANIKQVFDKWVLDIGREVGGVKEEDYALLFFADILSDGTVSTHKDLPAQLIHKDGSPAFMLAGNLYELGNKEGYRRFWAIYHRPPKEEYRNYLLERRDTLIPTEERHFTGDFYTPLHVVDKAYDLLAETLGDNWQEEYLVWDMCCGVGNLEVKHSNPRNVFMSTLEERDVKIMQATRAMAGAERFQYDYLNDDIADDGTIDYSLTGKLPERLRKAIVGKRRILVLINPPYAEASDHGTGSKGKVAKTKVAATMMDNWGKSDKELYTQFIARMAKEIPNVTLAMFSTLKYVNAPNFEKFRDNWNAKYLDGFIVHSRAFDGLEGDFPIGFLIWDVDQIAKTKTPISEITTEIFDENAHAIGEKRFYNLPISTYLNGWILRPKANKTEVIPLKNAITPATSKPRATTWADGAIAYLLCAGNDFQQSGKLTALYSSPFSNGNGVYVTKDNLWQSAVVFSVRRLVRPTWQNNRDQFLQPLEKIPNEFKDDCLLWMLFSGSNLTASADNLVWNGKTWSIVNHFIPFTEEEVGAPSRFESDFMVQFLKEKELSPEAQAVLDEGRRLWRTYFTYTDPHSVREELKLNRPDIGWYQIRNALERRNKNGDVPLVDFTSFKTAYAALGEKLRPQVYSLGFLKI